uniref:Polysaccharide biosynthesis domain-containing protein n=1 Tax=Canis lupus familiaris TaxID=9615 RepID=A0A8P0PCE9_CANLF
MQISHFQETGAGFVGFNMETTRGTAEPVPGELVSVAHALSLPAESYGNDPDIKMAWAMKAMQHAEVYYKKWRPFCLKFDGVVKDFNCGTLLRLDCSQGYNEENTIFAPGYNFLLLKLLRTEKAITKQFTPVFMTKKRKKATMEERKELTVDKQKRKEPTEKEKKQKPTKEKKKRKKPTKKSARLVKQLC